MEIKIIKDGLKNKDGGPLHTYEYNLKDKEIIDIIRHFITNLFSTFHAK